MAKMTFFGGIVWFFRQILPKIERKNAPKTHLKHCTRRKCNGENGKQSWSFAPWKHRKYSLWIRRKGARNNSIQITDLILPRCKLWALWKATGSWDLEQRLNPKGIVFSCARESKIIDCILSVYCCTCSWAIQMSRKIIHDCFKMITSRHYLRTHIKVWRNNSIHFAGLWLAEVSILGIVVVQPKRFMSTTAFTHDELLHEHVLLAALERVKSLVAF